ncbi:MAG: sigma 54-interacting transcriptional regulator [Deltaproteobacteria bacterium]
MHGALDRAVTTVGRGPNASVVVPEPDIGPVQFEVQRDGERHTLVDRSGGGTEVGGERVREILLREGMEIGVGGLQAVFRARLDEPPPNPWRAETVPALDPQAEIQGALLIYAHREGERVPFLEVPLRSIVEIGSGPDVGLRLCHPTVSARHARVSRREGRILLQDLGSTNGTWYEEGRVYELELPPGRAFAVGPFDLRVQGPASAARSRLRECEGLVSVEPVMHALFEQMGRVAKTRASVVLLGESGSGKERVAEALHRQSRRAEGPFVPLNCASLETGLVESELFGHRKGAFTGATEDREGAFGSADGGTLFLDEIAELSQSVQPKLLRAAELGEVKAVGAALPRTVDVRLIAASHKALLDEARAGRFRLDLYYRLAVVTLQLPPLRERPGDVVLLCDRFMAELAEGEPPSLSPAAVDKLRAHPWPGNVRELRNVVQRALCRRQGNLLGEEQIEFDEPAPAAAPAAVPEGLIDVRHKSFEQIKAAALEAVLRLHEGRRKAAARQLGLAPWSLRRFLAEHGLERAGKDEDGEEGEE